ncbi:FAD-dependent oxidoreductase [Neosynechococcus sphagnicola]|uniref:FAD-dependent oxidoreductase n=1 Tax=Neosynechococcus sphagnicola TaxID=1501145 RepID=UPI0030845C12
MVCRASIPETAFDSLRNVLSCLTSKIINPLAPLEMSLHTVLETDVLVIGGGTGGTAAAIQSARRGIPTVLVSEYPWLGGNVDNCWGECPRW